VSSLFTGASLRRLGWLHPLTSQNGSIGFGAQPEDEQARSQ
jgi:hypothetical protein